MNEFSERLLPDARKDKASFRPLILIVVPLVAILFQVYVPRFLQFLSYLELPLLITVHFALSRREVHGSSDRRGRSGTGSPSCRRRYQPQQYRQNRAKDGQCAIGMLANHPRNMTEWSDALDACSHFLRLVPAGLS